VVSPSLDQDLGFAHGVEDFAIDYEIVREDDFARLKELGLAEDFDIP